MEWQPINTAPKDGMFLFIESGGRIQVGRLASQWGEPQQVYVCLTGSSDFYPSINPTHWMPLPEPPK